MCWIIPVIVGLLSALLGYLLGKGGNGGISSAELQKLRDENSKLKKEVSVLREKQTFAFNDKSQFLTESQQLINKYKDGSEKLAKAVDDTVGKPSDISLLEADVVKHPLYASLLSQHEATQAELTKVKTNCVQFSLTDDDVQSHTLYQGLLSERDNLQSQLVSVQSTVTQPLSEKAVEAHEKYQSLLAKYHSVHDDLTAIKADTENKTVSADEVKSHELYQALQEKYSSVHADLEKVKIDFASASVSDNDVKTHSLYQNLLSERDNMASELSQVKAEAEKPLSEEAIEAHEKYQELLSKYHSVHDDLESTKSDLVNKTISAEEVETHELYQALQDKYSSVHADLEKIKVDFDNYTVSDDDVKSNELYKGLLSERDAVQSEFTQFKAETENRTISDTEVEQHAVYKDLLLRFNELKADLSQQQAEAEQLAVENKSLQEKSKKLDEDAVRSHPIYGELLTEYEQAKTRKPSEEEVKEHPIYGALVSESNRLQQDLHALENKQQGDQEQMKQLRQSLDDLTRENTEIASSLSQCEVNLATVKADLDAQSSAIPVAGLASVATLPTFDADFAKSVFGKKIKQDDLTVIEGIGPKIAKLFQKADIGTWYQLSEISVEDCQKVLTDAGERYKMHDPGTWPRQAKLASEGKWQELLDWQEILDGGRET